jgi:hypothetical protein
VAVLGETQLQEPWRRDGARYRPGEGVVGQVQLLQAGRERVVGDLPGEPVPGQVEHLELGQRGHVGERARETVAGEAERPQVFFYIYFFNRITSLPTPTCRQTTFFQSSKGDRSRTDSLVALRSRYTVQVVRCRPAAKKLLHAARPCLKLARQE